LDIDDDFGLTQFFLQALVLAPQFLVFGSEWIVLRLGSALLKKRAMNGRVAFLPPASQRRRIDGLATKDLSDIPVSAAASTSASILVLYAAL